MLLILKNIHATNELFQSITDIIELCARDHVGKQTKHAKKFSLRRRGRELY